MSWVRDILSDKDHPVWGMVDQLVKTLCTLLLFAGCLTFWAYINASNFDETEAKMITGATGTAGGYLVLKNLLGKYLG